MPPSQVFRAAALTRWQQEAEHKNKHQQEVVVVWPVQQESAQIRNRLQSW